jgi:hypothetical protein
MFWKFVGKHNKLVNIEFYPLLRNWFEVWHWLIISPHGAFPRLVVPTPSVLVLGGEKALAAHWRLGDGLAQGANEVRAGGAEEGG